MAALSATAGLREICRVSNSSSGSPCKTKCVRCDSPQGIGTSRPPSEDRSSTPEPGVRACPRFEGITVAGQRRIRAGFAALCVIPWQSQGRWQPSASAR